MTHGILSVDSSGVLKSLLRIARPQWSLQGNCADREPGCPIKMRYQTFNVLNVILLRNNKNNHLLWELR